MADNRENSYNLKELYFRAFGQVGIPFPKLGVKSPNLLPIGAAKAIGEQYQKRVPAVKSVDGSFQYSGALNVTFLMPVKLDGFQLWNEPLIELGGGKNIVATPIAGAASRNGKRRRGSVKELIAIDDYAVTIRGFIINEEDDEAYPADGVRKFRDLIERDMLRIECLLTDIFDIKYICVKNINLPALEGFPAMQPYEIQALSDEPFDFGTVQALKPVALVNPLLANPLVIR